MKNPTKTYKIKIRQSSLTIAIDRSYLPENVNYSQLAEQVYFDTHYHAWHEVFLVGDAPLMLTLGKDSRQYTNCILVIPPMIKHSTVRDTDYRFAVYYGKTENEKNTHPLDPLFTEESPFSIPLPQNVMFYGREIERGLFRGDEFSRDRIESCLRLIFCEIAASQTQKGSGKANEANETYLETIENILVNFRDDINLSSVAKEMGVCTRQASRIIQKNYRATFSEMLCEKRLDAACVLLTSTNLSIAEIVERVNFPSESYFYARFKKKYGQTPQQYRKEHHT